MPAVLAVVAVLFAGAAIWSFLQWRELSSGAGGNTALADVPASTKVSEQIKTGLQKVLSYDYTKADADAQAVKDHLTGPAVGQYETLFKTIKEKAPEQKIVVTAEVKYIGVQQLRGDHAELLAFVDQRSVRAAEGKTSVAPAQVVITAQQVGGNWKIAGITRM
ncbi:hypothetical protein D5S17_30135 [Pseudonocardiaceae bacterium YIM PH 21723]|nr:hypothetical protein D5S17_30135 [Pseudonocardiaceae bacterium YIM PH 21723]